MNIFFVLFIIVFIVLITKKTVETFGITRTQELINSRNPNRLDLYHLSQSYLTECERKLNVTMVERDICSDTKTASLPTDFCR